MAHGLPEGWERWKARTACKDSADPPSIIILLTPSGCSLGERDTHTRTQSERGLLPAAAPLSDPHLAATPPHTWGTCPNLSPLLRPLFLLLPISHDSTQSTQGLTVHTPDRSCNLDLRRPPGLLGRPSSSPCPSLHRHWLPSAVPWGGLDCRGPIRRHRPGVRGRRAISLQRDNLHHDWVLQAVSAGREPGLNQVSPVATSNTQDG